jgi:hypothetical protein
MRGGEREHIHISGDSSPICKRHLESMLKGIKSYLCLVQTGHVDIEYIQYHEYLTDNAGVIGNKREIFQYNETREILLWRWTTYHLCIYTDSRLGYDYWWLFINLYKWKSMNNSWWINIQKVTYHTCILLSLSALYSFEGYKVMWLSVRPRGFSLGSQGH